MNSLVYFTYLIPVIFILLSCKYMLQFKKLQGTGKIPYIIGARKRQNVFLCLAILSVLIIMVIS
jgi:hypothetical protein